MEKEMKSGEKREDMEDFTVLMMKKTNSTFQLSSLEKMEC